MQKNQKALIRHQSIYERLKRGETLNVKSLSEEYGVGERTIQKDLNERLPALYDIEYLGDGNYRLKDAFRFMGTGDDEDTKIAVSLMKSLQHSAIPQMDDYIEAALPVAGRYSDIFVFGMHFERLEDIDMFKQLIKAIQWKVGVAFTYTKADGSSRRVLADPYRLANFRNYWYLIAYDPDAKILKTYYLKNISDLEMLYENFTGNPKIEADIEKLCASMDSVWWNGERKSVLLEVRGIAMYYLKREIPAHMELVEEREEHYTVRFFYHHEIELFAYVKSWIPNIRILDDVLMKKLLAEVKAFVAE